MDAGAIALLVFALVVVWGGLAASIAWLVARPERKDWPQGWSHEDADG